MAYSPYRRRHSSRVSRRRRNAALGIGLGLVAIAASIAMVLASPVIHVNRPEEVVPFVLVFFAGYCGVMAGCWQWTRAKGIDDAILLVGLAPIAILCIPFVRLILFAAPGLLVLAMILMPLILVGIIAVLPSQW